MLKKFRIATFFLIAMALGTQGLQAATAQNLVNQYFNKAVQAYKNKDIARSRLYLEKLLRIKSNDHEARQNLEYIVKNKLQDSFQDELQQFDSLFYKFLNLFTLPLWYLLDLIWAQLLLLALAVWLFGKKLRQHFLFQIAAVILVVMFLFSGFISGIKYYQQRIASYAIIMSSKVELKSGPAQENVTVYTLHSGAKARITGRLKTSTNEQWYKLQNFNGQSGWCRAVDLEKI